MKPVESVEPSRREAALFVLRATGQRVASIERFPTGSSHYVFDLRLEDGRQVVARLTLPSQAAEFAGACYWYEWLRPRGVPLAEILHADVAGEETGFPALLLERLPGTDLGAVYSTLAPAEKRALAKKIVAAQRITGALPPAAGFGFACSFEDSCLRPSWKHVLDASLQRSRDRLGAAGVVSPAAVARVQAAIDREPRRFDGITPHAFLHDTTTKNVIVHHGRLSGIVDVDSLCFGDGLFALALTKMALLAMGADLAYAEAWAAELALDREADARLQLYTAIFCVDFLAELGQRFNRAAPAPIDPAYRDRLLNLLDALLSGHSGI